MGALGVVEMCAWVLWFATACAPVDDAKVPPGPPDSGSPTAPQTTDPTTTPQDTHDSGLPPDSDEPTDEPDPVEDDGSNGLLRVNEVLASNRVAAVDSEGVASDLIELVNLTSEPVSLEGFSITDDLDEPRRHVFGPDLVVPARGVLLLFADGMRELGPDHLAFSLDEGGEYLGLFAPAGGALDLLRFGAQARDLAAQRVPDGGDLWTYSYRVSPGEPNQLVAADPWVARGATWRVLDGGAVPGPLWTATGYDDSWWASGPAPVGYGDAHQITLLDYGADAANKAITSYARITFDVVGADAVSALTLELLRDDGVVVYLNGAEALRDNMPEGPVASDTVASVAVGEPEETAYVAHELDPALLVEGVNALAVEIHQASGASSDLGFDASLWAEIPGEIAAPEPASVALTELPALPEPLEAHVFRELEIVDLAFHVDAVAYDALIADGRTYQPATLDAADAEWTVQIRVKGNSTYRPIYEKPSLKVKFDGIDPDREYWGLPSVNLHNMTYDPSMVAESLSYWVYREAGLPAPRTGYARVTINGEYRGLYSIVEQKNSTFLEHWFADPTGSVYESGSFNWPCDVDHAAGAGGFACDCFEPDREGTGDSFGDLVAFCAEATQPDDAAWLTAMRSRLDWDAFLGTMATDMALAHIDSYGINLNNFHVIHEPTLGQWYWTPWSTDLAFGWYPWGPGWCGTVGTRPSDWDTGYLTRRCQQDPACAAELYAKLDETLSHIEALDFGGRLSALGALVAPSVTAEPYSWYTPSEHAIQLGCIDDFMAERPDDLRDWMGYALP